jgi:hypothetical protein
MKRSEFREYVFDWQEHLTVMTLLPYICQLDARLKKLSFRREPYSLDPNSRYRPFGMYLDLAHTGVINDAQLHSFWNELLRHFDPRFSIEKPDLKSTITLDSLPMIRQSEVEVIIKLPSGLEETRAVIKLVVLLRKACHFPVQTMTPSPTIANEPYVLHNGNWMTEGVYLKNKYFARYCQQEGC